jgi:hypothetical protein
LVWWSISIKLWWYVGVFPLNIPAKFNGNIPTYTKKVNGNTPTYQQSLIEISIKLWLYLGVFPLNFGGMVEYFN